MATIESVDDGVCIIFSGDEEYNITNINILHDLLASEVITHEEYLEILREQEWDEV